jgi:hypothetical protein
MRMMELPIYVTEMPAVALIRLAPGFGADVSKKSAVVFPDDLLRPQQSGCRTSEQFIEGGHDVAQP